MKKLILAFLLLVTSNLSSAYVEYFPDTDLEKFVKQYNGDYKAAYKSIVRKASEGNTEYQYIVGLMKEEGKGTKEDIGKAYTWIKKSAEAGNVKAQYKMGEYHFDNPKTRDIWRHRVAKKWFNKSSKGGNAEADYILGTMFRDQGKEVEYFQKDKSYFQSKGALTFRVYSDWAKRQKQALTKFKESARKGSINAKNAIAQMYVKNPIIGRDLAKAKALYEETAGLGSAEGKYQLALIVEKSDQQIASSLIKEASELGHSGAKNYLAVNSNNPEESFELLKEAAKGGDKKAKYNLAVAYEDKGMDKEAYEIYKTIKWLEKGKVFDKAWYNLALMYLEGRGTKQDRKNGHEMMSRLGSKGMGEKAGASKKIMAVASYNSALLWCNGTGYSDKPVLTACVKKAKRAKSLGYDAEKIDELFEEYDLWSHL